MIDSETIEKLCGALEWLVNECDTCDGFDTNLEGSEHEAVLYAKKVLKETANY